MGILVVVMLWFFVYLFGKFGIMSIVSWLLFLVIGDVVFE